MGRYKWCNGHRRYDSSPLSAGSNPAPTSVLIVVVSFRFDVKKWLKMVVYSNLEPRDYQVG